MEGKADQNTSACVLDTKICLRYYTTVVYTSHVIETRSDVVITKYMYYKIISNSIVKPWLSDRLRRFVSTNNML